MTRTSPRPPHALCLLWLLVSLLPLQAEAGIGPEEPPNPVFRIDAFFACDPGNPDLAALADGGFAVVWTSEAKRIALRRYRSDLQPTGPGRVVTEEPPAADGAIGDVAVAAADDGTVAVTWTNHRTGLHGRLFDAAGDPLTGVLPLAAGGPDLDLDLTALPDGTFVVAWRRGLALEALRFDRSGGGLGSFELDRVLPGGNETVRQPSVAVLGEDRLVIAWNQRKVGSATPVSVVVHRIFDFDGTPLGDFGGGVMGERPAVAARPGGGFVRVWRQGGAILLSGFDDQGVPLGPEALVGHDVDGIGTGPDVAVLPDDTVRVVWEGRPPPPFASGALPAPSRQVLFRRLTARGQSRGPVRTDGFAGAIESDGAARASTLSDGRTLVVARHSVPNVADPVPCDSAFGILGTLLSANQLVLANRFQVEVEWHDAVSGDRGVGVPGPQTADTGSFWFFDPDNLELIVKIVDGRPVNGHFWFFYGALSNVGYRINVTDLATGQEREYVNPPGRLASFADTRAFRQPETFPPSLPAAHAGNPMGASSGAPPGVLFLPPGPSLQIDSAAGPCSPLELPVVPRPGLCLADRRFEVEVEWSDPRSGDSGAGRPIEINDVTGAFWFFRPSNVELVVKVLDARPVNGRFWVLYGSLTDVEFTLRVRHTETPDEVVFENEPFEMGSGADTSTLEPPECNCPLAPPQPVCGLDGVTYNDACLALCEGWVGVAHPGPCEDGDEGS